MDNDDSSFVTGFRSRLENATKYSEIWEVVKETVEFTSGELRNPDVVLASRDRIAMDVEALKIIESFEGASLTDDPWSYTQIRRAAELGLGVKNEQEYKVINE